MKTTSLLVLLLGFVLVSPTHAQDRTPLFGLESAGLPDGEVDAGPVEGILEEATGSKNKFAINFSEDSGAKAETVQGNAGGKVLRMSPGSWRNTGASAALEMRGESGSELINAKLPLYIEVILRRSFGPLSLSIASSFLRDGELVSATFGGMVAHVTPEGTYSAFSTLFSSPPDEIQGQALPAEVVVTILYQLTQTARGLQVVSKVKTKEQTLFENASDPAFMENIELGTFQRFGIVVTAAQDGTGEEFLDLISIKAWQ